MPPVRNGGLTPLRYLNELDRPNLRGVPAESNIRRDYQTAADATPIGLSCQVADRQWGYFAIHPDLRADSAPVVWLAHLVSAVLVAPAPGPSSEAPALLSPAFARRAVTANIGSSMTVTADCPPCSSAAQTLICQPRLSFRSIQISPHAPMQHCASGVSLPADGVAVRQIG
jgi:hypothetical protein